MADPFKAADVRVLVGPALKLTLGTVTNGPAGASVTKVSDTEQILNLSIPSPSQDLTDAAAISASNSTASKNAAVSARNDASTAQAAAAAARDEVAMWAVTGMPNVLGDALEISFPSYAVSDGGTAVHIPVGPPAAPGALVRQVAEVPVLDMSTGKFPAKYFPDELGGDASPASIRAVVVGDLASNSSAITSNINSKIDTKIAAAGGIGGGGGGGGNFLVLGPADVVPTGTPDGTIILRTE